MTMYYLKCDTCGRMEAEGEVAWFYYAVGQEHEPHEVKHFCTPQCLRKYVAQAVAT